MRRRAKDPGWSVRPVDVSSYPFRSDPAPASMTPDGGTKEER